MLTGKKHAKYCVVCGKGTMKADRACCKHCGCTEWDHDDGMAPTVVVQNQTVAETDDDGTEVAGNRRSKVGATSAMSVTPPVVDNGEGVGSDLLEPADGGVQRIRERCLAAVFSAGRVRA